MVTGVRYDDLPKGLLDLVCGVVELPQHVVEVVELLDQQAPLGPLLGSLGLEAGVCCQPENFRENSNLLGGP